MVHIDSKLDFENHIDTICGKARANLHALERVAPFKDTKKQKMIINTNFNPEFRFYSLIWMFRSQALNDKIKWLHERCFRITYSDNKPSYEELLEKENSIYHRKLQFLATESCKVLNDLLAILMKKLFTLNQNSVNNTQNRKTVFSRRVRTVKYGNELLFLATNIWELVPNETENLDSVETD